MPPRDRARCCPRPQPRLRGLRRIAHLRLPVTHRRATRTTNLLGRLFLEERLSHYRPDSEICDLNLRAAYEPALEALAPLMAAEVGDRLA